jgi:hypothetical protein
MPKFGLVLLVAAIAFLVIAVQLAFFVAYAWIVVGRWFVELARARPYRVRRELS